jgi:hypothetical protein
VDNLKETPFFSSFMYLGHGELPLFSIQQLLHVKRWYQPTFGSVFERSYELYQTCVSIDFSSQAGLRASGTYSFTLFGACIHIHVSNRLWFQIDTVLVCICPACGKYSYTGFWTLNPMHVSIKVIVNPIFKRVPSFKTNLLMMCNG